MVTRRHFRKEAKGNDQSLEVINQALREKRVHLKTLPKGSKGKEPIELSKRSIKALISAAGKAKDDDSKQDSSSDSDSDDDKPAAKKQKTSNRSNKALTRK